ncbi:transcription elongation factor SPT5-like [Peromyscus leucopus]|uniref:transcription elongation factor SPT5-like n=1 Tax=Peromyscus leucopus TaxID=10041 RepID=UPI0018858755|nr:transcription elongation factor SPT5-like [Peromyscus leucopus]
MKLPGNATVFPLPERLSPSCLQPLAQNSHLASLVPAAGGSGEVDRGPSCPGSPPPPAGPPPPGGPPLGHAFPARRRWGGGATLGGGGGSRERAPQRAGGWEGGEWGERAAAGSKSKRPRPDPRLGSGLSPALSGRSRRRLLPCSASRSCRTWGALGTPLGLPSLRAPLLLSFFLPLSRSPSSLSLLLLGVPCRGPVASSSTTTGTTLPSLLQLKASPGTSRGGQAAHRGPNRARPAVASSDGSPGLEEPRVLSAVPCSPPHAFRPGTWPGAGTVRIECAEEGVRKGGCSGPWFLAWWASAQTRPRLRSRPDGGGLALAAA